MPAGELIEENGRARLSCSKQLLNDVICIRFSDKKLLTLAKLKKIHSKHLLQHSTVSICCNTE